VTLTVRKSRLSERLLSTQSGRAGSSIFVDLATVDGFLSPVSQAIGGGVAYAGIPQLAKAGFTVSFNQIKERLSTPINRPPGTVDHVL
jgi:hypothetical protein